MLRRLVLSTNTHKMNWAMSNIQRLGLFSLNSKITFDFEPRQDYVDFADIWNLQKPLTIIGLKVKCWLETLSSGPRTMRYKTTWYRVQDVWEHCSRDNWKRRRKMTTFWLNHAIWPSPISINRIMQEHICQAAFFLFFAPGDQCLWLLSGDRPPWREPAFTLASRPCLHLPGAARGFPKQNIKLAIIIITHRNLARSDSILKPKLRVRAKARCWFTATTAAPAQPQLSLLFSWQR